MSYFCTFLNTCTKYFIFQLICIKSQTKTLLALSKDIILEHVCWLKGAVYYVTEARSQEECCVWCRPRKQGLNCVCLLAAGQTPSEALWDQPDGGADSEGHYSVLRLCHWKAEGPLPQHSVLQGNWLILHSPPLHFKLRAQAKFFSCCCCKNKVLSLCFFLLYLNTIFFLRILIQVSLSDISS